MAKTKKKLTREEKLAKDRLRKKLKYAEVKSNPELYRIAQEKEKQRYLLKKERKTVVSIHEMSERAKREKRRQWRKNAQTYLKKIRLQKKIAQILVENSPPESEIEDIQEPRVIQNDPLADLTNSPPVPKANVVGDQNTSQKENTDTVNKTIRRIRYNYLKELKYMSTKNSILQKENEKLRRINQKHSKKIQKSKEDTLEKKVDNLIKDIKGDKIREVKRKLLFSETITRGFSEKYKQTDKKDKRSLAESVIPSKEKLAKYRIISKLPFSLKKKQAECDQGKRAALIKLEIQQFFEEDVNSQIAAGKKECIKKKGIRKQKRYLTDHLKNLHAKYCKQVGYIGYSTFCRYRPFWVVQPSHKRDTCQCKLHANVNLLAAALRKGQIINEKSATDILSSLCCNVNNSTCLQRSCNSCKSRILNYNEFDNSKSISYYEWMLEKQSYTGRDGKKRFKNVTIKKKKEDKPRNIIKKIDSVLKTLFKHCNTIVVQYFELLKLKENLAHNEIICHIDFSENYCLKHHEEVQSFHFGGSRGQVSLHTGVLYYVDEQKRVTTKSFCTMSQCLNHDASAIWAHITPILDMAQNLVPSLTSIHFVSDSPSSQYRNRFIFHILTKLKDQVSSLQEVTWSYLEAGHGKGAPDGVGAVVKRAADNYVKYGGDVGSFEDFAQVVEQNVQKVELIIIPEDEVSKKRFLTHIPGFKGTTKVHQAIWSKDLPYSVAFRSLSCFACRGSFIPCEHNKHLGVLSTGIDDMATTRTRAPVTCLASPIAHYSGQNDQELRQESAHRADPEHSMKGNLSPLSNTSAFPELNVHNDLELPINKSDNQIYQISHYDVDDYVGSFSPPQIDTPTFNNNLRNLGEKSSFNGITNEEIVLNSIPDAENHVKQSVNIISNIPYNYQRFTARQNSTGFNSIDQTEFEKFLNLSPNNKVPQCDLTQCELTTPDQQATTPDQHVVTPDQHVATPDQQATTPDQQVATPDQEATNPAQVTTPIDVDLKYDVDMWVIAEYKLKKTSQFYIGKIIKTFTDTKEYRIIFVRKIRIGLFSWPAVSDEDTVTESQIIQRLEDPQESRRGQLSFANLPKLNFK